MTIRPATEADADYVGNHLRSEDEREVKTSTGLPGARVVPLSFRVSRECYAVFRDSSDKPCAVFGVADDPKSNYGVVWFLATDEIRRCPLSLLGISRTYLDRMARHYIAGLHNYADQRNDFHIRWAKLAGFITDGVRLRNGHRFIHIIYKASPCANHSP